MYNKLSVIKYGYWNGKNLIATELLDMKKLLYFKIKLVFAENHNFSI